MEPRQRQTLEEWLGDVPGEKPNPVLLPVDIGSPVWPCPRCHLRTPRISEVLPKEGLEFRPGQGGNSFLAALVLLPSKADPATKKRGCEGSLVGPRRPGGVEMVLGLSAEVVTLHMRLPELKVVEPGF